MSRSIDASIAVYLARNRRYYLDGVLQWFEQQITEGSLYFIEEVRRELEVGSNRLAEWAVVNLRQFPIPDPAPDLYVNKVQRAVGTVAELRNLPEKRILEFLDGADSKLIAQALFAGSCVVTDESRIGKGKIRIPEVCGQLEVECTDLNGLISELGHIFDIIPTSELPLPRPWFPPSLI